MGVSFVVGHRIEVGPKAIEARLPHPAIRRQPVIDLDEGLNPQAVPAAGPVHSDGHEPGVSQDPEVLGRQRLGKPEGLGELTDEVLAAAEAVENRSPDRLRQHFEGRGHRPSMSSAAYAVQRMGMVTKLGGSGDILREHVGNPRSPRCSGSCGLVRRGPSLFDDEGPRTETQPVSEREIDEYLAGLDETKRATLQELRRTILEIVPGAEQCISYGMPAFKVRGKAIAGFAAFKNHLSYFPHSGSVLPELPDEVAPYAGTKGTLRFAVDTSLPKALVKKLIAVRMSQIPQP
jgi:uncharacterized protein YdhG (YjbR/CyaY superfamily)